MSEFPNPIDRIAPDRYAVLLDKDEPIPFWAIIKIKGGGDYKFFGSRHLGMAHHFGFEEVRADGTTKVYLLWLGRGGRV